MVAVVKVVRTIEIEVPDLGRRIQEARKLSPKTVTELAAAAGMSAQNWYRIEAERQELSEAVLRRIEAALELDFGIDFP